MPYTPRAQVPSVVQTVIQQPVSALASSSSVGDSIVSMTQTPLVAMNSQASLFAIDVGSVNCEVRAVSGVSGVNVTFTGPLTYAHSAGAPVVWLMDGEAPLSFWGAKGDGSDDTLAVQAAILQSTQPCWVTGVGRIYIITRPLMFVNGCHLRNVTSLKATSGSWLGTPEATNALGISCQDFPVVFAATAADNTLTCVSNHNTAVGNKVALTGTALPSPLIQGRVYFVKTTASATKMTLALTSGGAEIDITADGPGVVYPDVNALERVYLDDVAFDGGAISGMNGFLHATQQPSSIEKLRTTNCPGYGLHIGGQSAHLSNVEVDSCGTGIVLSDVFGATQMKFYDVQAVNNSVRAIHVTSGAINCLFSGLWIENGPIGIDIVGGSGNVFDGIQYNNSDNAAPLVKVHIGSSNSGAYELRGCRVASATQKIIDDVDRGFALTAEQIDQHQNSLPIYSQPGGYVAPFISNNSVRLLSTTPYTAHLADETILCNATGASITVNLPSAADIKGKRFTIKKTDATANTVTVDPSGAQTIDGSATSVLSSQYQTLRIISDLSNWAVI